MAYKLQIEKCRICSNTQLNEIANFKKIPIRLWPTSSDGFVPTEDLLVFECALCSHLQIQNLNADFITSLYEKDYMNLTDYELNRKRSIYLKKLFNFGSSKILDVGGGTNPSYQFFQDAEYSILDPQTLKSSGIKHIQGMISTVELELEYFDYIFAFHIFEHLENPRADLQKLSLSMSSKGRIIVEVPDSCFYANNLPHYLFFHQHINLFTRESLDLLFELEGFIRLDSKEDNGRILNTYTLNPHSKNPLISKPKSDENSIRKVNKEMFDVIQSQVLRTLNYRNYKEIIFLGAGGSTTLLMYHLPKLLNSISYLMDSDIRKIGLKLPGTDKKIHAFSNVPNPEHLYIGVGNSILNNWPNNVGFEYIDLQLFLKS